MELSYEDKYYTVDGQEIHVVEKGQPGRQVAVLIHGWSSSWFATSPILDLLSQRFHCIAVDLPGYGDSPPYAERTTIPKYVETLAGLIEQVSDGPVVLVGHSMGGMISITMALQHPILVERMVLLSPTISGKLSTWANWLLAPVTLMERFSLGSAVVTAVEKSIVGLTDSLMRPALFAQRSDISSADYERIRMDARRSGQGRVRGECYRAMRENDLQGRINGIETPTLILWGAEDNTVPLRDAGVVADEWPLADLRIIPKAGHWPHFETPETSRRQVAAYLGLPRSGAELTMPVEDEELLRVHEVAQFLAHSALGDELNLAQRTRLAAQMQQRHYDPGEGIVHTTDTGRDLYIIQKGTVEVWQEPDVLETAANEQHNHGQMKRVAILRPGQITGEMAMLDQGERSADLLAGKGGATVLSLDRERLMALCEDDAVLGTRVMWNLATAVSRRARFILWQLNRSKQRQQTEETTLHQEPELVR
jgi:pimeloyl-ACP methyl ester carboxylesterase/CRP-like cAMP-binding protein